MYNFQIFQNEVWVPAKTINAYCSITGREYEVAIAEIADAYCEAKRNQTMAHTAQGWAFETERAEFQLNSNRNNHAAQAWVLSFRIKQNPSNGSPKKEYAVKTEADSIPLEAQREIYQVLTASFEKEVPLAMAKISKTMSDLGYSKERYGFPKMKALLEQLPFLTLENEMQGGVMQTLVTIRDTADWERREEVSKPTENSGFLSEETRREIYQVLTANFEKEVPLAMAKISKTMSDLGYSKERYGFSKMKALLEQLPFLTLENEMQGGVMQTFVTIHTLLEESEKQPVSMDFMEQEILPSTLDDTVHLPSKTLVNLNLAVTGVEQAPPEELIQALRAGYQNAWETHSITVQNGAYVFFTGLFNAEGSRVIASLKPTTFGSYHWYLNYAGVPQIETSVSPGKALEKFAFLGSWQGFLEQLAGRALSEPWDFKESAGRNNFILKKYIQYTFYRLSLEDKISISEDGSFAAFNTGLVTPYFDDIYACFEPQQEHAGVKWRFLDFCTAAARGLGKKLVDCFSPLPEPASYFEKKEDLLFDLEKELHTDYEHIILDNLPRLPLDFVKEECRGCERALLLIERIPAAQGWKTREELYQKLSDVIGETPKLYNRMRNRLEDAIKLARKQVRWNFKTAIPCYFPTGNTMSLMLPLALQDERKTDVALVVELTRSGNYQGQTVLTLQQAYVDGRLLCRPNSEWLDVREIREEETADD